MALLVKALKFLNGIPTDINPNTDSLYAKSFVVGGATGTELTKAILDVLSGGSNVDAGSLHMHDGRYFRRDQTIAASAGVGSSGAPIKTDARGKIDPSFYQQSDFVHGNLSGLSSDDHPQYLNNTRGDARYFKKVEHVNSSTGSSDAGKPIVLNAGGKIDGSMIDPSTINHENISGLLGGAASDHYHLTSAQHTTLTSGSGSDATTLHSHDSRYYTKSQIDTALDLKADDSVVIKKDGSVAFFDDQSMGGNKLTNLADAVSATDAVNLGQMQQADALKVAKSGDAMSGTLNMSDNAIVNIADPVNPTDAANKRYVDLQAQGIRIKESVRAATTEEITLSGLQTIDGVELASGNRVLVKDQTLGQNNGIYIASSSGWLRSNDANTSDKVKGGLSVFVNEGTVNKDTTFTLITDDVISLGSTSLLFTETSRLGQIVAGTGLSKTAETLSVNLGAGITEKPSDEVGLDLHVSGGLELIDPTTQNPSENTNAKLAVKLDGLTLTRGSTGLKVSAQGITTTEIANNAVTTVKILDANVTTEKLADDAVTTDKILDANVTTEKLADDSVTKDKLNSNVAGEFLSQNLSGSLDVLVETSEFVNVDNKITLATEGVTTSKIADSAITEDKVDFGTGPGQISSQSIPIVDTEDRFQATNVEEALQELANGGSISIEVSGETIGVGDLVCIRRDASGIGRAYRASADGAYNYVAASLELQDITYTAIVPSGNNIRIRYVDPEMASAPLSVSVSNEDITVNLETDNNGIITSTADDIQLAVSLSSNVSVLVAAEVTGTGSNIQSATIYQDLSGGMDFNDNGHWDVYGMALDAAIDEGENIRIKKMGKIACQFDVAPTASQIGKSVYLSVNLGKASIGVSPTAALSAIVHLGRLVSETEVDFRGATLRGVHS